MGRLRILLLAPEANPEGICGALIGYSETEALAQLHDVTIVALPSVEKALLRKQGAIRSVEVVKLHRLERLRDWALRCVFKHDFMTHAQTILAFLGYPLSIAIEWQIWRQ